MRKAKNILLSIFAALFLSACSLGSGNDGGIYRSDDGGKSFAPKNEAENNKAINAVDVLSLAINPQNGREAYLGTKASGIFKSENAGDSWRQLKMANLTPVKVYSLAVDPNNSRTVYATVFLGGRGKIIKSSDSGENWEDVYTEPSSSTLVLSLAVNPQNSDYIYAGTDQGLILLSENGGETWKNIHTARAQVYKIAVDYFNPQIAYFVVFGNTVLRTDDNGKMFHDLSEGKQFNFTGVDQIRNATAIATDPGKAEWVYLGTEGGLFRSKDRGENWESVKVLLKPQEQAVRGVSVNPQNSDEIIFGAGQTFYKSVDGGQSWATVQNDSSRSIEVTEYNRQNPAMIYVGMNKR